jgi:hypothetical protein
MRAAERGIPVAIVNIGPTRGDDLAAVRVDASVTEILQGLAIHSDAPEAPLESTRA